MEVRRAPDPSHAACTAEAIKVLRLPLEVNALRWHPFGVYSVPLAARVRDGGTWSRRLHLWHPGAEPVGEASPYGVHTHSGPAVSHVLVGALHHHLYAFEGAPEGDWRRAALGRPEGRASLIAHARATTTEGVMHHLPKDHPHGVTKPDGWAVSLFEQLDGPTDQVFTTWQRTDVAPQPLMRTGPADPSVVRTEALATLERVYAAISG